MPGPSQPLPQQHAHPHAHASQGQQQSPPPNPLPQAKHVVAVGAGKGGVGKSTIAVNLAVGLQRRGLRVGIMDGDVYGPSLPTMLGIKGQTPVVQAGKIQPFHVHGLFAMTIGPFAELDKPLIWRGPMAQGAFKQLFVGDTQWPELDYMIIDLPPGTGDVPLTLCQMIPLTGAVLVATPQQVALDDAIRAARMFQQLGVPVLGVVENMSYIPTADGGMIDMFGRGGATRAAQMLGLDVLGEVPMYPELRVHSDAGKPHANFETVQPLREVLEQITARLIDIVEARSKQPDGPALTIS